MTANKKKCEFVKKEIEISDVVYLYNDGKHIVDSFTKSSIRFKNINTGKIQTVNKNTFLKKHFYRNSNCWILEQKGRLAPNMDYL